MRHGRQAENVVMKAETEMPKTLMHVKLLR